MSDHNHSLDSTSAPQLRLAAFGAAIRKARGDEPQVAFAARLGLAEGTISQWEGGLLLPQSEQLLSIEEILDLPRGWFLVRAGFVERDALLGDRDVISTVVGDFGEVSDCLAAAERLGFGVQLWNENEANPQDPESSEERWILSLQIDDESTDFTSAR